MLNGFYKFLNNLLKKDKGGFSEQGSKQNIFDFEDKSIYSGGGGNVDGRKLSDKERYEEEIQESIHNIFNFNTFKKPKINLISPNPNSVSLGMISPKSFKNKRSSIINDLMKDKNNSIIFHKKNMKNILDEKTKLNTTKHINEHNIVFDVEDKTNNQNHLNIDKSPNPFISKVSKLNFDRSDQSLERIDELPSQNNRSLNAIDKPKTPIDMQLIRNNEKKRTSKLAFRKNLMLSSDKLLSGIGIFDRESLESRELSNKIVDIKNRNDSSRTVNFRKRLSTVKLIPEELLKRLESDHEIQKNLKLNGFDNSILNKSSIKELLEPTSLHSDLKIKPGLRKYSNLKVGLDIVKEDDDNFQSTIKMVRRPSIKYSSDGDN